MQGRVAADGGFRLDETYGAKVTGVFEGSLEPGRLTGNWRDPEGRSRLPFALQERKDALSALSGNYPCSTRKKDSRFGYTHTHAPSLGVATGVEQRLVISRDVAGGDDTQSCSIDLTSLKQAPSEAGILLKSADAAGGSGSGPRCTIHIVGDDKFLYVEVGDFTDADDDCRASPDEMFCSPRAFGTDMIVDRMTKGCKSVE